MSLEKFCDATVSGDYPQWTNSDRPMGMSKELARKATVRKNAETQFKNWNNSMALKDSHDLCRRIDGKQCSKA